MNRAKIAIRNMLSKKMSKELISEILEVSIDLVEEVYKEKFFFDKFEWENNKIGMDRIVLPPYQPLKYLGKSSVKTLMSQYDFAYDNQVGLISKIASGKAKNLLAEPIIIRVNNQVAKNVKGSFAFIEKSKDLALIKQNLAINNLNLAINHQVEYDNFIKTTLVIKPKNNFKFNSMTLDIPLETAFAKQIHTTCNTMKYNAALAFENKTSGIVLPHLAGTITNLDKAEMDRTLVSIDSEVKRRQHMFNQARDGLDESTIDIYKYQRLYHEGKIKVPIPHLFIICEFFVKSSI